MFELNNKQSISANNVILYMYVYRIRIVILLGDKVQKIYILDNGLFTSCVSNYTYGPNKNTRLQLGFLIIQ